MSTLKFLNGIPIPQAYSDLLSDYEALKSSSGSLQVVVMSIPEVEVKNDIGNPLPADIIDRSGRVLGKIAADDAAIAQIGALAAAAITDPTVNASVIALLKGLLKQLQGTGSSRTVITPQDNDGTPLFTSANPGSVDVDDRALRVLGKISADDGSLISLGAKADAAAIDPSQPASALSILKGLSMLLNLRVKEPFSGTTTTTHTFATTMLGIAVSNDDKLNSLTFTVDSLSITLFPGEIFNDLLWTPFTEITITANGSFRAWGRG